MKKKFFSAALFLIAYGHSNGQFADFPHSCWQQKAVFMWDFTAGALVDKNVITYLSDTVVCSRIFKKCLFESTSWASPAPDRYIYVRCDSGKVYLCMTQPYSGQFGVPTCPDSSSLLFDFNLMPGDTFSFMNGWSGMDRDTVASATYVSIGGIPRKKITFNSSREIIDGIGDSRWSMLYWPVGFEGAGHILICQKDSAGTVYQNPYITGPFSNDPSGHLHQCDSIPATNPCLPLAVKNTSEAMQQIVFSPNPFSDKIFIRSSLNESLEFVLYDSQAEIVSMQKFRGNTSLIAAHLAPGIYFYQIKAQGKPLQTGKLVKQ